MKQMLSEELQTIKTRLGADFEKSKYMAAAKLLEQTILGEGYSDFLTVF